MQGPPTNSDLHQARSRYWLKTGVGFAGLGSGVVGLGASVPLDANLRALVIIAGLILITFGLIFFARLSRVFNREKTVSALEPISDASPSASVTWSIPGLNDLYMPSEPERPLIEEILGREVVIDQRELKTFYGMDISSATTPVRDQLRKTETPYLTVSLDGVREIVVSVGGVGEHANLRTIQIQCSREAISHGDLALSGFTTWLSPGMDVERESIPILIMLKRDYFEGIETEFLEALRQRLNIPIFVEKFE